MILILVKAGEFRENNLFIAMISTYSEQASDPRTEVVRFLEGLLLEVLLYF